MFKVATNGGFLMLDEKTRMYDTHPDARMATIFPTFKQADEGARHAVRLLFGPVNQYYDIMISVSVLQVARRVYQKECEDSETSTM